MAYIIAEPCINTKDTACVDVCPVDCIHPRKDEANFAEVPQLYIDPVECIDCGACVPVCPVSAISHSMICRRSGRALPQSTLNTTKNRPPRTARATIDTPNADSCRGLELGIPGRVVGGIFCILVSVSK